MKIFYTLATTVALATAVLGDCNPLKSSDCPADSALADSFKEDFLSKSKYFEELNSKGLSYGDDGAEFSLKERFDNPSIKSDFYIMFGKVEVVMKAAPGQGIISSFYLQSDDLDEIDIELFGGKPDTFQSNYFSKGDTSSYTRGGYYTASKSLTENFVTYTLDWSKDSLSWAIDGNVVRTLYPNDPQGYPQSPMSIFAGIWAGGDSSNPAGTIEWAGGSTTYGPTYSMFIKSLIVTDYSTGDKYSYSDKSGSWESIKSDGGEINGRVEQAKEDFQKLLGGEEVETETSASSTSSTSSSSTSSSSSATTETDTTSGSTASSSSTSSTVKTTTSSTSSSTSATTSSTTTTTSSTSSTSSTTSETKTTKTTKSDTTQTPVTSSAPVASSKSTTVWWTPSVTQWWTPATASTDATKTDTAATNTATATNSPVVHTTNTNTPATTPSGVTSIATTLSTSTTSASSSSSAASSSAPPEALGSLDSGVNQIRIPYIAAMVPLAFFLI